MSPKHKNSPFINVGSSLLIMIFLILCLVTFAALSLSSAHGDYTFSEKLANRKTAYYTANNTAEKILGEIDALLAQATAAGMDASALQDALAAFRFSDHDDPIALLSDFSSPSPLVSYQVPIDAHQALAVEIELNTSWQPGEEYYKTNYWKIVSLDAWQGENTLNLIPTM